MDRAPGYLELYENGELAKRAEKAVEGLRRWWSAPMLAERSPARGTWSLSHGRRAPVSASVATSAKRMFSWGRADRGRSFCQLQPDVRLLPELRHQCRSAGLGGERRTVGEDDAQLQSLGCRQYQLRLSEPCRAADT